MEFKKRLGESDRHGETFGFVLYCFFAYGPFLLLTPFRHLEVPHFAIFYGDRLSTIWPISPLTSISSIRLRNLEAKLLQSATVAHMSAAAASRSLFRRDFPRLYDQEAITTRHDRHDGQHHHRRLHIRGRHQEYAIKDYPHRFDSFEHEHEQEVARRSAHDVHLLLVAGSAI